MLIALAAISWHAQAADVPAFTFEAVQSLDEMAALIRARYPLDTPRGTVRTQLVEQGHATLKESGTEPGTEKYLYDINLCGYYVWRWNISADYDTEGRLRQAYVNGNLVFADGTPKRASPKQRIAQGRSSISRLMRQRPEASKGESVLSAMVLDLDGNAATTGDQYLMGAGPSNPDPLNMGKMLVYMEVDPWRSIFDADAAERIVGYQGDCSAVDARINEQKAAAAAKAAGR